MLQASQAGYYAGSSCLCRGAGAPWPVPRAGHADQKQTAVTRQAMAMHFVLMGVWNFEYWHGCKLRCRVGFTSSVYISSCAKNVTNMLSDFKWVWNGFTNIV